MNLLSLNESVIPFPFESCVEGNKSTNQQTNQNPNQLTKTPTNQLTKTPTNRPASQAINQPMELQNEEWSSSCSDNGVAASCVVTDSAAERQLGQDSACILHFPNIAQNIRFAHRCPSFFSSVRVKTIAYSPDRSTVATEDCPFEV